MNIMIGTLIAIGVNNLQDGAMVIEYLLQEDGFKFSLEDGSGFILI